MVFPKCHFPLPCPGHLQIFAPRPPPAVLPAARRAAPAARVRRAAAGPAWGDSPPRIGVGWIGLDLGSDLLLDPIYVGKKKCTSHLLLKGLVGGPPFRGSCCGCGPGPGASFLLGHKRPKGPWQTRKISEQRIYIYII
jgi:hypothetical protein